MNLEFFIKLKEMVSGGLVKMAQTAKRTASDMKGSNKDLAMSYDMVGKRIQELESNIRNSTSVKHIRETRKELQELQKMQSKHIGGTSSGGGGFFGNMIKQALPAMGIAGMLALGGGALMSGLDAQARQTSFEVMAGKAGGTRLNNDLTKYAQDSIYGSEVFKGAQTMLGFGISDKDVLKDTKMLGDIAMGSADKMQSLTLAFSQVSAGGKLTGQDLLQFINAGFNPLQEIAKSTGKSIGVLKEEMSDGKISFAMVEGAFKAATSEGGRFYNMTNKIAETDFGKLQAFMGQLEGVGMKLGGVIAPAFGLLLSMLSPLLDILSQTVTWMGQHKDLLGLVSVVLLAGAAAYGAYTLAMSAGTVATTIMTAAQTALNFVMSMNPIGAVIALIAGLVAGVIYAWNKFEGFRMAVWGLWGAFKQVFSNIGDFFKKIFDPIFKAIDAFKDGRFLDAGKAVAQMAYNLSPVGLAVNAAKFTASGGLTNGVKDAYNIESLKGKRVSASEASGAVLSDNGSTKTTDKSASEAVKGITSGGPRVININGVKFAEQITIKAASLKESKEEIIDFFNDCMLRTLNSGAAVQ